MAYFDTTWYCNSVGYAAITVRPQNTAVAAGVLRRQFTAPAVGSERVFVCIIAGTTANVTDATWVLTRGAKTVDGTVTWMECTGQASLNGDSTNTPTWAAFKASAVGNPSLGVIIKRNNGASYQICTTGGAISAAEPAFSDTAGTTTTDTSAVWTSLGVVGNFTGGQAPFARLASAFVTSWVGAGHTVYVGDNHAESQASAISISATQVTYTTMTKILCVDRTKFPPTSESDLRTTATVTTTGANTLTFSANSGNLYVYGITFSGGTGAVSNGFTGGAPFAYVYYDSCLIKLPGTGAAVLSLNAGSAGVVILNNTTMYFGATTHYLDLGSGTLTWQNTGPILAAGSAVPANFMGCFSGGRFQNFTFEAVDLSQITGNWNYYPVAQQMGVWLIKDCKLNAAATVQAFSGPGQTIQFVRSSS